MAIVYPLSTPTNIGIANIIFSADNATAISQSPFTFAQQIVKHQGERWRASVSLPPMKAVDAEYWIAFLLSLRGQYGTFLLKDPNYSAPRGLALTTKKNLLTFTEQFDNAAWIKDATTLSANATIAPDGTVTADQLIETITTASHDIYILPTTQPIGSFTYSIYVKASGRTKFRLQQTNITSYGVLFDLVALTATTVVGGATGVITNVGNGWYRCSMTYTTVASFAPTLALFLADAAGLISYTGNGTSGIYLWGAQLELGSTATSYQSIYDVYGPYVNGAGQTGSSLSIDGASPNELGYLIAGDYIQLGSAGTSTLHKVLTNVDTNNLGQGTIELWPSIRTAPADNATITLANPSGKFRLSSNTASWEINNISSYGITFDCVEAI